MDNKTKIFVSAYACEPDLGSEIGVGWHWVLEMSKYFELWVLTRKSNQNSIENWMNQQDENYNIHFLQLLGLLFKNYMVKEIFL